MSDFKLDNHPKIATGFKVPEQYFKNLSERIMQQLPKDEPKVISIFSRRKSWITIAAAVLLIALFVPIYNTISPKEVTIDSNTLENYINYQASISQEDLINLLDDKDVEAIDLDLQLDDTTIEDVLTTNNNFENYILD